MQREEMMVHLSIGMIWSRRERTSRWFRQDLPVLRASSLFRRPLGVSPSHTPSRTEQSLKRRPCKIFAGRTSPEFTFSITAPRQLKRAGRKSNAIDMKPGWPVIGPLCNRSGIRFKTFRALFTYRYGPKA
jgi:hypothetical protein